MSELLPKTRRAAAMIEKLEARIAPAGFLVRNVNPFGPGSLSAAINASNDSEGADTIRFRAGLEGPIVLGADLPEITGDLFILGPAKGRAVLDGGGQFALIDIQGTGLTVTLQKLKLRGGSAEDGGGVSIDNAGGQVLIKQCVITGNVATGAEVDYYAIPGNGGGVVNRAGTLTLDRAVISANRAELGGGVANFDNLVVKGSTISANTAVGYAADGGGLHNGAGATATIEQSTISGNVARGTRGLNGDAGYQGYDGYAGEPGSDGEAGSDGSYGYYGGAGGNARGGGIFNAGTLTVVTSTISGNTAQGGAGGDGGDGGNGGNGGRGGPAYSSEYGEYPAGERGYAGSGGMGGDGGAGGAGLGGGIFSAPSAELGAVAALEVKNSTISGNTAQGGRGGAHGEGGTKGLGSTVDVEAGGYATVDGAPGVDGIAGLGNGGGVAAQAGQLTLSQVTIAQNTAESSGGGLYLDATSATIGNCTIAANVAALTGGGVFVVPAVGGNTVEMISSIVANNSAPLDADLSGTIAASFSLVRDPGSATLIGTENMTAIDPLLGTFKLHGGVTKNFLPATSSAVVDQGANPAGLTTDQRDRTRVRGSATDIGAIEVG